MQKQDALGWRKKFGVIAPSTNTIVQPDFEAMRPYGVTNHVGRIFTENNKALSNEMFMAGTEFIAQGVDETVRSVMTCDPDYLVMGMSAITFYGGRAGADAFQNRIKANTGLGVSVGSHSCAAALNAYGNIKRIAFVSPYYPVANEKVREFFDECGFETVRDICLKCAEWWDIAKVTSETLREALIELNGDDVDAIIQVGTNMSMVRLAAAAELWLGKPVIAINTATYWHALRTNGINDKMSGFGRLLEEF
jgi:maleate isomerase